MPNKPSKAPAPAVAEVEPPATPEADIVEPEASNAPEPEAEIVEQVNPDVVVATRIEVVDNTDAEPEAPEAEASVEIQELAGGVILGTRI